MKFSCYLPDYNELESSQFSPHPRDPKVRRLRLEVDHVVAGEVGGRSRHGKRAVGYNLDFGETSPYGGRMVLDSKVYSGVQSTEFLAHEYDRVRSRTGYAAQHYGTGMFDMRAIMYVLGAAQMGGVSDTRMLRTREPALYKTLGGGYVTPRAGDVTVGPSMFTTRHEFITMLMLFGEAGVKSVQLMTDYVPGSEATLLTGKALARYAQRLAFNVLYAANSTVTFGLHFQAYLNGMLSVCTLNAHSDEGGWIRRMFTQVDYCVPCGVLFCMDRRFGLLPLAEKVSDHEIARNTYGMFLEGFALLPVGDYKAHGKYSIATRPAGSRPSINSYEEVLSQMDAVMTCWRELLCEQYDAHRDGVQSYGDFNPYIGQDPEDRHFESTTIVPWWFIEPSPFILKDYDFYETPAMVGRVKELPLFRSDKVTHSRSVVDPVTGSLGPGATIGIVRSAGSARMEGFSYLLSGSYHRENGLGQITMQRSRDGEGPDAAMFFDPKETVYGNQRWVLPDCGLVNPYEGYTVDPQQLYYKVVDHKSLTPKEVADGTVRSFFGTFRVAKTPELSLRRLHSHVPERVKRALLQTTWDPDSFQFSQTTVVKGTAPSQPELPPVEPRVAALEKPQETSPSVEPEPNSGSPPKEPAGTVDSPPPHEPEKLSSHQPPPPSVSAPGERTPAKVADMGIKPKPPDSTAKKHESPDESRGSD